MLEGIIIGIFLGGFIGVAFMAILQVGKLSDREDQENESKEGDCYHDDKTEKDR